METKVYLEMLFGMVGLGRGVSWVVGDGGVDELVGEGFGFSVWFLL